MKKTFLLILLSSAFLNAVGFGYWELRDTPQHIIKIAKIKDISIATGSVYIPEQKGFTTRYFSKKKPIEEIRYADTFLGNKTQNYLYFNKKTNKLYKIVIYMTVSRSLIDTAIRGKKSVSRLKSSVKENDLTTIIQKKLSKKYGEIISIKKSIIPGNGNIYSWKYKNALISLEDTLNGCKLSYIDLIDQNNIYRKNLEQL